MDTDKLALGIEFGSTRIKAVLVSPDGSVAASGSHDWENSLADGLWTYSREEILDGMRSCYASLKADFVSRYGFAPRTFGAMGISGMMHGYIALDKDDRMIYPFLTWRNTNTQKASDELTELFGFNVPLRWTISHLYRCMLDKEEHLGRLAYVTTLAGYVHLLLSGEKVLGVGDCSGIFPIDPATLDYDARMVADFEELAAEKGYPVRLSSLLPRSLAAGENAGALTAEGAALLDPDGDLLPGTPMVPAEGDAGTGMVATNAVTPGTGNLSAGTSVFAMVVLRENMKKLHREIDVVTTPDGAPVAMSHSNNGTGDIDAWVRLLGQFAKEAGLDLPKPELYDIFYNASLRGEPDCGGTVTYGFIAAEPLAGVDTGRPALVRDPSRRFDFASFTRANILSALAPVRLGLDVLTRDEGIKISSMTAHGGLFKTPGVAQRYLAASLNCPVTVMRTAGEGGPWGMALLALYGIKKAVEPGLTLPGFLDTVFENAEKTTLAPVPEDVEGFTEYMENYKRYLKL